MSISNLPDPASGIRIGFVNRFDARNVHSWSGTLYFMARALERHVGEVVYLGPDDSALTRQLCGNIHRINRWVGRFSNTILLSEHNRLISRRMARVFEARLSQERCDVLFAPAASVELARLNTSLPIVYASDTTWADIIDYYPEYSRLSAFSRREGERVEAAAITRADASVYPSAWAARSAIEHYRAPEQHVSFIPFGANLATIPDREAALDHPIGRPLKLLLMGVSWERKGGPIAFECLQNLLASGVDAELTVCGCTPPPEISHPRLRVIPFLNKSDPLQSREITRLFLEANFLLLPTRAEALGIVICEASAHGLPVLVSDTGGTRGALSEGANGYLLPLSATGKHYADRIRTLINAPGAYRDQVVRSRDEYERVLNWDAWGLAMRDVIGRTINRAPRSHTRWKMPRQRFRIRDREVSTSQLNDRRN
jgi:glycosyltransferase involved in cell wall biosynthesis